MNVTTVDILMLMRGKGEKMSWINSIKWSYPFLAVNVFTSKPEPENPSVKKPKDKTDLADDPEKFKEPFECFDILHAIIIKSQ